MTKITLHINFSDVNPSSIYDMVEQLKPTFVEDCKKEGEDFKRREWKGQATPQSWVEAYVRYYDIDGIQWWDFINTPNDVDPSFVPQWQEYFDEWVSEQLETKLRNIISNLPVEVEV